MVPDQGVQGVAQGRFGMPLNDGASLSHGGEEEVVAAEDLCGHVLVAHAKELEHLGVQ